MEKTQEADKLYWSFLPKTNNHDEQFFFFRCKFQDLYWIVFLFDFGK